MNLSLFFKQLFCRIFHRKRLKIYFLSLLLMLLFFSMLLFPKPVLSGAESGLLLWFNIVLPTLFPFIFICNLCMETDTLRYLLRITGPLLCRFFNVSSYGSFAVLTGFLCGYPMGSKVAADLYRHGYISQRECSYLVSFCNNTSPMFIISFLVIQNLRDSSLIGPTLFLLFLSPVLCSFLFRHFNLSNNISKNLIAKQYETEQNKPLRFTPGFSSENPLDHTVSDSLEAITKVGAYIIIFSVLTELFYTLPLPDCSLKIFLLSCLEITRGISLLCGSSLPKEITYILSLFLTSFGGLCAAAQTQSMLRGTGISLSSYITKKLVTAVVTSLLACIYLVLFIH